MVETTASDDIAGRLDRLESENLWLNRLIYESRDGIVVIDENCKVHEANTRFADMLGYSEEEIGRLHIWDWECLHSKDQILELVKTVDQSGQQFETRHRRKDGKTIDVELSNNGFIRQGKKLILCICRDITERKRADVLNIKTTEILQMIATGRSANCIYDSIALMYEERHPGLRCSMLILKGNTLLHGGAPSLPEEYCLAVNGLKNGPDVGSCGTSTYTGETVLVEDIATDPKWRDLKGFALKHGLRCCWSEPIKDSRGKVMGAFGMYYNHPALPNEEERADLSAAARLAGIIMEREQRELLLKKLSSSLEQSGEAILITDPEGSIEFTNAFFSELTGYQEEEVLHRHPSFLDSGQQKADFYPRILETISNGESWKGRVTFQKKNGSHYPAQLVISPVRDHTDRITHYIAVHTDLTEQQRLEEQLRQAQKMDALGTLVGGIAHDFNNTLAGITGNLHLAKRSVAGQPKVLERLNKAEILSLAAGERIQYLLAFARKGIVQKQTISLSDFIRDAINLHRVSIPENVSIDVAVEDALLIVDGDVNQLQQLLLNLLNNARDAVENVSHPIISIKLSRYFGDPSRLKMHPNPETAEFARLRVSDNGCGIDQQHLQQVFEPFFTTKALGKGTGLGLSMVYGTVKSHDGFIEVTSRGDKQGTSVDIYLPISESSKASLPTENPNDTVSGQGEWILLVDDNDVVRETGKALLEDLNYQIVTAKNGQEAVEIYRSANQHIAALILDVVMPHMGGVEALRLIRQQNPAAKALFCTGYDKINAEVEKEGITQEEVLTKPFKLSELSQKLRTLLDQDPAPGPDS